MKSNILAVALFLLLACGCQGDSNPNVSRARVGIKQLADAAAFYNNNTGAWPDSLDVLTLPQANGGEPLLAAHALKDPWGRPYEYNSTTTNPQTGQPQIWSEGPNPGEAGSKIANWD